MSNREKFLDNLNFEEKVKIATKKKFLLLYVSCTI